MPGPVTRPFPPAIPTVSAVWGAVACRTEPRSSPASQNDPFAQSSANRAAPASIGITPHDVAGPAGFVEANALPFESPATQTPADGHDIDSIDVANASVTTFHALAAPV